MHDLPRPIDIVVGDAAKRIIGRGSRGAREDFPRLIANDTSLGIGIDRKILRLLAALALMLCGLSGCGRSAPPTQNNLLYNGNLARGSGDRPADWYAITSKRDLSAFSWTRSPDGASALELAHSGPNYSSWHQRLMLAPGTYRVSAEARIEGATSGGGATIAVEGVDGSQLTSIPLHRSSGWEQISIVLNEDRWGATTEILCQLGAPTNPDTGRAWFRDLKVMPIVNPGSEELLAAQVHPEIPWRDDGGPARAGGAICGIALYGLLAWALVAIWRPPLATGRNAATLAIAAMLAITAVKFAALFHFTGYFWDIWSKTNRALLAAELGPSRIYDPGLPIDAYPPGSLYVLWLSGSIGRMLEPSADGFRIIVETPPLIADFLIGLTLYFATWRDGRTLAAFIAMLMFALNPALIYDTTVWGQSDSIVALPMIAATVLILAGRYRLGWIAAAIAILAKPQALATVPILGLWTLFSAGIAETAVCVVAFGATVVLGILPFQLGHPWNWTLNVYQDLSTRYSAASVGAFNFHALLGGIEESDTDLVFGVSYRTLGFSLTFAVYALTAWMIWRARSASAAILAIFVTLLGFFLFTPRMHERYLYYPLVFITLIALEKRFLTLVFAALTGTLLFNLIYMKHLTDTSTYFADEPTWPILTASAINLAVFVAVAGYAFLRTRDAAGQGGDSIDFTRSV
ncbi:MAG: hypothetical protein Q7S58_20380 [Candidatus Binatus sp.]|uniref:hypothetical protein n=1 Tax=Candidatus Binatus sp. TaxID=2811406 RepID=UPI00271B34F2|nr:hypothetical protein [Candidatus Binatus sp.]MDO8434761.1 hypothetical protein [Candidatus Binatus sp.]